MLGACGTGGPEQRGAAHPSVLLITVDSLRADRLGCLGYQGAETPHMDALAARGALFTRAVAPVPESAPSIASIFTGLYPASHGLRTSQTRALSVDAVTLAELMKQAGYRTGAVAASLDLHTKYGLDQGFESYLAAFAEAPRPSQLTDAGFPAGKVADMALGLLQAERGKPFFLWINFFDPHYFYTPPEPFASRYAERPYDGEIAYVDRELGRVLAKLADYGIERDTVVVLAGTNGEGLGDRGEDYHGVTLQRATTQVPLIIAGPGFTPGSRVPTPVSLVDLAPTILELAGLPAPPAADGVSLVPATAANTSPTGRPLYLEATLPRRWFGWSPLTAVVSGDLKYVKGVREELFDLAADPNESRDLAAARPEDTARLGALARGYDERAAALEKKQEPPAELMARIAQMGLPVTPAARAVVDPRDAVAIANDALKADRTARRRQLQAASFLLQQVLMRDQTNYIGLLDTALLAGAMGDEKSKKLLLERTQSLYPQASEVYRHLAYVNLMSGHPKGRSTAVALFGIAAGLDPANEEAAYDLACALAVGGDKTRALDALEHAVAQGYRDFELMGTDTDLDSLRDDPRFETITAGKAHKPVKSAAKPPAAGPAPARK